MGYLYIMETDAGCKVGVSEHDVNKRKSVIQTGCPHKIDRVWCSKNIPDYRQCEKIIHGDFADKRITGEWFDVPFVKLVAYADKITKVNNQKMIDDLNKKIKVLESELSYTELKRKADERKYQCLLADIDLGKKESITIDFCRKTTIDTFTQNFGGFTETEVQAGTEGLTGGDTATSYIRFTNDSGVKCKVTNYDEYSTKDIEIFIRGEYELIQFIMSMKYVIKVLENQIAKDRGE